MAAQPGWPRLLLAPWLESPGWIRRSAGQGGGPGLGLFRPTSSGRRWAPARRLRAKAPPALQALDRPRVRPLPPARRLTALRLLKRPEIPAPAHPPRPPPGASGPSAGRTPRPGRRTCGGTPAHATHHGGLVAAACRPEVDGVRSFRHLPGLDPLRRRARFDPTGPVGTLANFTRWSSPWSTKRQTVRRLSPRYAAPACRDRALASARLGHTTVVHIRWARTVPAVRRPPSAKCRSSRTFAHSTRRSLGHLCLTLRQPCLGSEVTMGGDWRVRRARGRPRTPDPCPVWRFGSGHGRVGGGLSLGPGRPGV